ncbi:MAG: type II CAAX endopeptidase family protein [Candidatus Omnitrophota bacterium]
MRKTLSFIKREWAYVVLLALVSAFTVLLIMTPPDKGGASSGDSAKASASGAGRVVQNDREAVEKILASNDRLSLVFTLVSLLVIALFLLGVVIDLLLLASRRSGAAGGERPRPRAKWGMSDVFKTVILYLFFGYTLLTAEVFLMRAFPVLKDDNFRMILNTSIMDVLVVTLILRFTVVRYKEKMASLGLSLKNFFRNVYYGIVAYIAFIPVLVGIIAVLAVVMNLTGYAPRKQPVVDLFLKEQSRPLLLYTSLFASVAGPVIEELFFRGFMYNAVKRHTGVLWATLITAASFALLHAHIAGFLPILALGILLAHLYERTGTLVSSVTVHVIHNVGMVLLVFLVKKLGVY